MISSAFLRLLPLSTIGVTAILGCLLGDEMSLVKIQVDSFTIAGISVRTSNAQEATKDARIPRMWQRLMDENLLAQIPNRVDNRVVALYTDYKNGKQGMYTYILGAKVSSTKNLPGEFVSRTTTSGQYAMFTEQGGPPPEMTVNLWKRIWSLEKPGGLGRAYKTDFEIHYVPSEDVAKSHVDIYIGLLNRK